MRRRRLIGVYRGLLMSIWMPWLRFDVMSAAAARGGATKSLNMRRVHMAKLADHAAQHNRVKSFCCACPKAGESFRRSVALTMVARYARPHVSHRWMDVCRRSTLDLMQHTFRPNGWGPGVEGESGRPLPRQ